MVKILTSLAALITAVALVTLANATMTTIMPLRMLQASGGRCRGGPSRCRALRRGYG